MVSQKITEEIRNAIWSWYQDSKMTQTKMASLLGVKNPSVNDWMNGVAKTIRPKNWDKLLPYIKKYLSADSNIITGNNSSVVTGACNSTFNSIGVNKGTVHMCNAEIEDFRRRTMDALMEADLPDEVKIKIYSIVKKMPIEREVIK